MTGDQSDGNAHRSLPFVHMRSPLPAARAQAAGLTSTGPPLPVAFSRCEQRQERGRHTAGSAVRNGVARPAVKPVGDVFLLRHHAFLSGVPVLRTDRTGPRSVDRGAGGPAAGAAASCSVHAAMRPRHDDWGPIRRHSAWAWKWRACWPLRAWPGSRRQGGCRCRCSSSGWAKALCAACATAAERGPAAAVSSRNPSSGCPAQA